MSTGAAGVMSAEGMLDDPALFFPGAAEDGLLGSNAAAGGGCGGTGGGGADETAEEKAAREARKVRKKLREIDRLEGKPEAERTAEEKEKISKRKSLQK